MADSTDSSTFQVERFGDVMVAGDGPWVWQLAGLSEQEHRWTEKLNEAPELRTRIVNTDSQRSGTTSPVITTSQLRSRRERSS